MRERSLIKLVSNSALETFELGQRIAAHISKDSVIALKGALGSGKTLLSKGIADGLGIKENLLSPTYTIINEYPSLFHIDAYRLSCDRDFEDIGGLEVIASEKISIIEWSERIPKSIPDDAITISLEITGALSRVITIEGLETL
ncbi:MAG: tRNA (adenosine(37)-N6)-threonylcarbamoyltransferase complex ATPase subunit type 1 TsaE [Treponema sp.]|jgi:tRNA threonylcarbamoyladenosine biosynthesis protein TsaE|nr:tRNA (adenosine(37)-N6)-threonylcarbamoyltransferase complex ATPase subunit type 1 TsaE [Treponema sp.]